MLRQIGRQEGTVVENLVGFDPAVHGDSTPVIGLAHVRVGIFQRGHQGDDLLAHDVFADVDGAAPHRGAEIGARNQCERMDTSLHRDEVAIVISDRHGDPVGRNRAAYGFRRNSLEPDGRAGIESFCAQDRVRLVEHGRVCIARPSRPGRRIGCARTAQAQRMVERSRSKPNRPLGVVAVDEQWFPLVMGTAATDGVVIGVPARFRRAEGDRCRAFARIGVQMQGASHRAALDLRWTRVSRHGGGRTQDDDLRAGQRTQRVRDGQRARVGGDRFVPLRWTDGGVIGEPEGVEGRNDHDGSTTGNREWAHSDADGSRNDDRASFVHGWSMIGEAVN